VTDKAGLPIIFNSIALTDIILAMRIAFKMKLKPGFAEEYQKRHDALWPALKNLLKDAGIYDYSIYLDEETNTLFAVQKTNESGGSQQLAQHDVVQEWWKYMEDIMETNPDHSPVSVPLREVFRLE
jgi:L-rhamnose mutarotase